MLVRYCKREEDDDDTTSHATGDDLFYLFEEKEIGPGKVF